MGELQVFRWLLDVGDLWSSPSGDSQYPGATTDWAITDEVKGALDLLPSNEREKVLRFYRPRDARLSLASNLLKHRAIVRTCNILWTDAVVSEDANRKPCYIPVPPAISKVEFNISHHGTLVALVGCAGETLKLGVDVVQMNWERDSPAVLKDGFEHWANIYEAVFSEREISDIAHYCTGESDPKEDIRAKLRHFYAHWCLKEAYIKMTGEALMAPWLKDLEFRNVNVPPSVNETTAGQGNGVWGQTCGDVEIFFRGSRVTDVKMELQAYGGDYMIGTAATNVGARLDAFEKLDLVRDVYSVAGRSGEHHIERT